MLESDLASPAAVEQRIASLLAERTAAQPQDGGSRGLSAQELAAAGGTSLFLAAEQLESAEGRGRVSRDDALDGRALTPRFRLPHYHTAASAADIAPPSHPPNLPLPPHFHPSFSALA